MTHWKYLWRREFVELRRGGVVTGAGWVDELAMDGTILWIHRNDGMGRTMIDRLHDGIDIWRVDPRVLQNRPETADFQAQTGA
ncbi:hypothetical protein [Arthrobacter sp. 18067]|uniref:hypothetical protein n=1 Tax=Arthrobacter sp. 18067 TaxID=2681413 RepID=UPI00135B7D0C|nr:hypothetical protein [Arthrobacter sp. 18067]